MCVYEISSVANPDAMMTLTTTVSDSSSDDGGEVWAGEKHFPLKTMKWSIMTTLIQSM